MTGRKYIYGLTILGMCAALFFSVPADADFGWADAGHHAFDGLFYKDLIADGGFWHPVQYTMAYYQHYPAVTPVMYPPFFGVAQIPGYALIGPYPWVARLTVILFLAWGAWGMIRLTGSFLGEDGAFLAALMYIAMPVVLFWGRDVMLEPSAMALIIWSFSGYLDYLKQGRTRDIALCLVCATLAPYTKQNTIFIFPTFVMAAFMAGKARRLTDRRFLTGIFLSALCGIPLVYVTLRWGTLNLTQSFGDMMVQRTIPEHIFYYISVLPESVSWPFVILSVAGAGIALYRKKKADFAAFRPELALFVSWAIICYFQMAAIQIKEPRHGFFWLPLFAIPAAWGLRQITARFVAERYRLAAGLMIVIAIFGFNLRNCKMNWSAGFRHAAEYVTAHWEGNGIITNLYGDASFIFHIRALDPDRRYRVYRSSKVFESMMVYKEWRQETLLESPEAFRDSLKQWGVRYVLLEKDVKNMTPAESFIREAVKHASFRKIAGFPVVYPDEKNTALQLYRYDGDIDIPGRIPEIHLPIVGKVIPAEPVAGQNTGSGGMN